MNKKATFSGYKTRGQIAAEYGISAKTLKKKPEATGIFLPPGLVSLRWQECIHEALGFPHPGSQKKNMRTDDGTPLPIFSENFQ
ncbi:MAG TPA: hypothetical protein ENJ20_07225 [Bacteroidetes bacterium]|nr:hypothetical protein [Bacteroidota bacterium]